MAKRTKDEEVAAIANAETNAPTTEQQPTETGDQQAPAADAPAEELATPVKAFNLLREKNPGDYPEWEGLSDKEREVFTDLCGRVDEEEIQGNPYVQCVMEVLNV